MYFPTDIHTITNYVYFILSSTGLQLMTSELLWVPGTSEPQRIENRRYHQEKIERVIRFTDNNLQTEVR